MMLTKPKEEEEGTEDSTTNNTELLLPPPPPASLLQQTTTNDLEKELERRLSMLGKNDDESKATPATATTNAANKEVDVTVEVKSSHNNEDDLISFDEPPQKPVIAPVAPTVPSVTTPFVAPAVQEIQAKKPAPAPSKPNKSALLARIMAAQEKAKQEQIQQQQAQNSQMQQNTTTRTATTSSIMPPPPFQQQQQQQQQQLNAEEERQKMMRALNGIVDDNAPLKQEKKSKFHNHTSNTLKPPSMPPPQFTAAPPPTMPPPPSFSAQQHQLPPPSMPPPPSFSAQQLPPPSMPPPPPSFQQHQTMQRHPITASAPAAPLPPPSFDTIENDLLQKMSNNFQAPAAPPVPSHHHHFQAPSAPPTQESLIDNFHGVTPMAPPPPTYPPTTFDAGRKEEQGIMDDALFLEFDFDGGNMSLEEKRKMMEEQRAIMEEFENQKVGSGSSSTAHRSFSNVGDVRMANLQSYHGNSNTSTAASGDNLDFNSVDPAQLEEQRAIMEDIERRAKSSSRSNHHHQTTSSSSSSNNINNNTSVGIGDGKNVALHGQDKTKEAIKDGTAILVQCINCDNWMQLTAAATLMYCPICKVVSPVVKQDGVTHEALQMESQMEEDRKLAEKLQRELQQEEGGDGSANGGGRSAYPGSRRTGKWGPPEGSSSSWWGSIKSSMGMSTTEDKKKDEAALPPGTLLGVTTGEEDYGQESLVGGRGNGYDGDEDEVHGVDTTSFLAIPNVGDDKE